MPTLMNMTTQNIEQTLTELTETWIQQNIHDFSLLKTSILENEPISAIMDELRKRIQTLQQQEKERITRQLQITAIHTQKTKDDQEEITDKQEAYDDNVRVIASRIDALRDQSSNMAREKEQIKQKLEVVRHDKLDTRVKELINQALLNQIREDETPSDNDQRDARTDANLERDLKAVEQKIIEAKARLTQKKEAVQDRIVELNNQYQDDPKQLKEKTGQSAFDYVNVGNWQNRDETLQKLRRHEKKATNALDELKAEKKRLSQAIETRPIREQQRQQRNEERKSRKKARKAAATLNLITSVLDALLKVQPETSFVLNHDVIQQLSSARASYLQAAISRARESINRECETKIQQAFRPINQDIAKGDAEISRLTERLKGVAGRVEKRRIQAENRQKRSEIHSRYSAPSTTDTDWEAQLSSDVRQKLVQDIGLEQRKVEQEANNLYSQAQKKSWSVLFDRVSDMPCADADDKIINVLKKICGHIAHHQQSMNDLKQLELELSTMRGQVIQDEKQVSSLFDEIDSNKKQIEKNKLWVTNEQEAMPFLQNQVNRGDEENASLRIKTLGYVALTVVLLIITAVVAVGLLSAGPIVGAILMSMFAIAAIASISAYMEWSTASSILEQRNIELTEAQDNIQKVNQDNCTLTRKNDDLTKSMIDLQNKISDTNQDMEVQQRLISHKTADANRSLELAQIITPDNSDPVVSENCQLSAPPRATLYGLSMFSDVPVAVAVLDSLPLIVP